MSTSEDSVGWLVDLDTRDALRVTAFRNAAVALGQGRTELWRTVERHLGGVSGDAVAREAMPAFVQLMRTLGRHGRRQIRFHAPDCPCVGHDEITFLALCDQAAAGRSLVAARHAAELVEDAVAERLVEEVAAFQAELEPADIARPRGNLRVPAHADAAVRLH